MTAPQNDWDPFGQLLRSHRMRMAMSQEVLARRAEVAPRTIRYLETGRSRPRAATLGMICDALNLSTSERDALVAAATNVREPVPANPAPAPMPRRLPVGFGPPKLLPPKPHHFTGREPELSILDGARDGDSAPILAITGPGGVGKTWLALSWAYQNLSHYPDGQLYVNLRGFEAHQTPLSIDDALWRLLYAIDKDAAAIPRDLESRIGQFRSRLADARMLILLDNAVDADQVLPLIPGGSHCATLVTSRTDLIGLTTSYGAQQVRVTTMDEEAGRRLLSSRLPPDRLSNEPEAVRTLLRHCAGLPLALALLAARAAANPDMPLADFVAELTAQDDTPGSDELSAGLRSLYNTSCSRLSDRAQRLYTLLGLLPRPTVALHAVASLAGLPVADARATLRELESVNLVERYAPGRFRMHDLTHLCAAERASAELTEADQLEATERLADHYLFTSMSADRLLAPSYQVRDLGEPSADCAVTPIPDSEAALEWFTVEHSNIMASLRISTAHHWHDRVWKQAWLLRTIHRWNSWYDDDLTVWQAGYDAAAQLGDPLARALASFHIGAIMYNQENIDAAESHLDTALELSTQVGDLLVECNAYYVKSLIAQDRGELEQALHDSVEVLRLARAIDHPGRLAEALNGVGWTRALLGQYDQGRRDCVQALELLQHTGNVEDLADVWDSIGYISHHQDRYGEAIAAYGHALDAYSRLNPHSYHVARVRECLGDSHVALGDAAEACVQWRHAMDCHLAFDRLQQAEKIQAKIDVHCPR